MDGQGPQTPIGYTKDGKNHRAKMTAAAICTPFLAFGVSGWISFGHEISLLSELRDYSGVFCPAPRALVGVREVKNEVS